MATTAVTTAPAPTTTAPPTTPPSTTPPSTAPPTTAPAAQCVASQVRASFLVIPGSGAAGHLAARVVLTNVSPQTCRTYGYPGLQLVAATGKLLPTKVLREPGTEAVIPLPPGESASAVAIFSPDVPGPGDAQTGQCQPVATQTRVIPPNDTHYVVATGPDSPVCESGTLQLRPLQPGAAANV